MSLVLREQDSMEAMFPHDLTKLNIQKNIL